MTIGNMAMVRARRLVGRVVRRLISGPRPAILMYHRVAVEPFDPWGLAVSPAHFASQLDWLARYRQVISLPLFAKLHQQGKLPANAIALTFDDGYFCNADVAAPLLEARGLAATIFLPTELIAAEQEFWWDDLERIVLDCPAGQLHVGLESGRRTIDLGEPRPDDRLWPPGTAPATPRQAAFQAIWEMLKVLEPDAQREAMDDLREQAGTMKRPRPSHRPMTADEIRRVQSERIEMGGHSLTHTSLSARDASAQAIEIAQSREQCALITGIAPACFAYPYGDYDTHSPALVAAAGFSCACTTNATTVSQSSDPFALPRLQAGNWTGAELARALRAV